jgi:hypothetical protein
MPAHRGPARAVKRPFSASACRRRRSKRRRWYRYTLAPRQVPSDRHREEIEATFGTRSRGWFCRNLTQWLFHAEAWCPIEVGRPCARGGRSDGGAIRSCRRGMVFRRSHTGCSRAGRHRWARDLGWGSRRLSQPGDHAVGRSSDHYLKDEKTAVFTVSRVERFPKSQFAGRAVYGAIDHAGLRLITCG